LLEDQADDDIDIPCFTSSIYDKLLSTFLLTLLSFGNFFWLENPPNNHPHDFVNSKLPWRKTTQIHQEIVERSTPPTSW
jgi:hypothetical protein